MREIYESDHLCGYVDGILLWDEKVGAGRDAITRG